MAKIVLSSEDVTVKNTERYKIYAGEKTTGGPGGYESVYLTNEGDLADEELYSHLRQMDGRFLSGESQSLRQRNGYEFIKALRDSKEIGIASGFKPSGPSHIGHELVASSLANLQRNGMQVFMPIADVECEMDGKSNEDYFFWAADNLLDWGAGGVDLDASHVYLQSEERRVNDLAYLAARGLTFDFAIDTYSFKKLCGDSNAKDSEKVSGEFPFLFAGITQVGDILLPQHPDFANYHSIMLSGQDQDGHMKMTDGLARKLIEAESDFLGIQIQTPPSGLYISHIRGLVGGEDGDQKMSSRLSSSTGTIYLGSGHRNLDVEGRVVENLEKFDWARDLNNRNVKMATLDFIRYVEHFNDAANLNFEEMCNTPKYRAQVRLGLSNEKEVQQQAQATRDQMLLGFCESKGVDVTNTVRGALESFLRNHHRKREEILDYAVQLAEVLDPIGWSEVDTPDAPEFWKTPKKAIVDPSLRNKTKWYDIVVKFKDKLIP
jgi:tryptophanyl-tRNA synthetase